MVIEPDTHGLVELAQNWLCIEASTLGLKPGEWPGTLPTTLGNRQPLVFIRRDQEVAFYRQLGGPLKLDVLND